MRFLSIVGGVRRVLFSEVLVWAVFGPSAEVDAGMSDEGTQHKHQRRASSHSTKSNYVEHGKSLKVLHSATCTRLPTPVIWSRQ